MNFNDIIAALPSSVSELLFSKLDNCDLTDEYTDQKARVQLEQVVEEVQNEMVVDSAMIGMVRMLLKQVPQAAIEMLFDPRKS